MAQPATGNTPRPTLRIAGRVAHVRKLTGENGTTFRTLVKTPAPDAFSSPATFELRSGRTLGQVGVMVEVDAEVQGFARSYKNKDGETVPTAEVVLSVQ